ncbi:hypothetical protein HB770_20790 [Rhizobium leguminosarum bv. viciae]|uniref:Transmembrane protein n=1 Tax=Rhizobium leguminosarum bv. viciae TaxID=387 RepID=A0A7G6RL15_RHILV|nr:hypothetical protein HB770_20790 [Rhizobium leguminosarum bv. viciae]
MPSASTMSNGVTYVLTFVSLIVAGLISFDWLTFFTPEQALKIVGALNMLGLLTKAWITTAEQMAKRMQPPTA